ncbi:MAG: YceI family protein [Candidatus Hydrogenedentes bacterium]|nr:YceI family protein [Candidatus Hydrogenedentota bacterium]
MNKIKVLIAFVLGGVMGLAVGGFVGHAIANNDDRINTAPGVAVVEVQEVKRPPKSDTDTTIPVEASPAETPAKIDDAAVPDETQGGTEEYAITPNNDSELMWVGYKTVLGQKISMEGGFANFTGALTVVNNSADESYVDITVDISSLFSVNSILTGVLKGDEFFDVKKYPEAKFVSTKVEPSADGYTITGNFTMHGITQGIQFPATIERRGDDVYVEAEFKINRKQWDVGYDSFKDALVLEEVVVSLKVLAEAV